MVGPGLKSAALAGTLAPWRIVLRTGLRAGLCRPVATAPRTILRAKPSSSKGRYLKKVVVSTTTGPGIPVDPQVTRNFSDE